jgi:Tfp pilus assembly protein PilE
MAMKHSHGFTVIELIVAIVFIGAAATLLLIQRNSLEATHRDNQRKTAINAMYYSLEEVFYEKNGFYPSKIDSKTLRSMDPDLFTDPDGTKMNSTGAEYHYNGLNCGNETCKSYKLTADMEKEAAYTKTSRH